MQHQEITRLILVYAQIPIFIQHNCYTNVSIQNSTGDNILKIYVPVILAAGILMGINEYFISNWKKGAAAGRDKEEDTFISNKEVAK